VNAILQPLRDGDPRNFQGWTVNGLLGEGGQSTIYLAEKNGRAAALKIIRKEYLHDAKSVDRFFTEIKNLEMLNHPNIAAVLEVLESGFAIEFIDGPNLEKYVEENGPLEIDDWWKLAQILAATIHYCHSQGIVHKDISPKNIVLGPNGPVIIDFGISYLEKDPRLTAYEETVGTPPFMSPEHHGPHTPKEMDTFSLAGTLIFLATGHYPFKGSNSTEWREAILHDSPDFDGLTKEQIKYLAPLLFKKPEERVSILNFAQAMQAIISGKPLTKNIAKYFPELDRKLEEKLTDINNAEFRKRKSFKKIFATSALLTLLSITVVALAIVAIQNSSSSVTNPLPNLENKRADKLQPLDVKPVLPTPVNENSNLQNESKDEVTAISKDIQINLDLAKKFFDSNQLNAALKYAKLAANAGNAQGMYRVAYILTEQGKTKEAITWYQKATNLGYGDAFWNLGALYEKLEQNKLALEWYEKGAERNNIGSLNALGYYYGDKLSDYRKALPYYEKSAGLGSVMAMSNLGLMFEKLNDLSNALFWYEKASDLGSISASINLGSLYEKRADWNNARKYYKRAADKKDPLGMFNLSLVLSNHFGQIDAACTLLSNAILLESSDLDLRKLIQDTITKTCANEASSTQPISSKNTFEVSLPVSPDVKKSEIFGRVYKDNLNYWRIILSNFSDEKVPQISAIQFRMIGFADAGWMNVPFKLKKDEVLSTVYAQVDDFLFSVIFKDRKYCPEFRAVKEESGQIVQIWEKGKPECSSDYNP